MKPSKSFKTPYRLPAAGPGRTGASMKRMRREFPEFMDDAEKDEGEESPLAAHESLGWRGPGERSNKKSQVLEVQEPGRNREVGGPVDGRTSRKERGTKVFIEIEEYSAPVMNRPDRLRAWPERHLSPFETAFPFHLTGSREAACSAEG
jgi:hypothetical protein